MTGGRAGARNRGLRGNEAPERGEIYLEYTVVGAQMRAIAIDAATGTEVTVFGPTSIVRDELGRLAVRKLLRRMAALAEESAEDPPASGRPGTSRLV